MNEQLKQKLIEMSKRFALIAAEAVVTSTVLTVVSHKVKTYLESREPKKRD